MTSARAGFTLIEVLVALAVFAMAAVALLHAQTTSVRALAETEARTMADIVAENQLVAAFSGMAAPRTGTTQGEAMMAGRAWQWRMTVETTGRAGVLRVAVVVSDAKEAQVLSEITGFYGVK